MTTLYLLFKRTAFLVLTNYEVMVFKRVHPEKPLPANVFKKRSSGYSQMGEEISKQVQYAIDHAATKIYLCRLLGISFPTMQDRLYADSWTAREKLILRENGIIRGRWLEVDDETNETLGEGKDIGTLYPKTDIYVRKSRNARSKVIKKTVARKLL